MIGKLKSFVARFGRWTRNTKIRYTLAAIGMILVGAIAGLVQNSFAESSPTKTTATRSSAPAAPEHINVNPMGTAADNPGAASDEEALNKAADTQDQSNSNTTNNTLDFTFNPPSVTLSDGEQPTVAAATQNEQNALWTVTSNSSYIRVVPQTGASAKTDRFLFTVSRVSSSVPAGDYTVTVTASVAGTQTVTHHLIVHVLQSPTFKLQPLSDTTQNTSSTIYLPFEIDPTGTQPLNHLSIASNLASPSNAGVTIAGTKDWGATTSGEEKAIKVEIPAGFNGTITADVLVTDNDTGYSYPITLSYTVPPASTQP